MSSQVNRRSFMKQSLAASAGGVLAASSTHAAATGALSIKVDPGSKGTMPMGKIGNLQVSRMLLGGNLLTHYTHSRDLQYVYNLCAHYNTDDKILDTLALCEQHGINTLVVHTAPRIIDTLKRYRRERNGKMQWIVCPTADIDPQLDAYAKGVEQLVNDGADAIYLWGVRGDSMFAEGKVDLMARAVEIPKEHGLLSGVGAHDIGVIKACEEHKIPADFYIKTFHHHNYPRAPKNTPLTAPTGECPGYWCRDPQEVIDIMAAVEKPWIAFKVMAAGAIPPKDAFQYAFANGADHVLAGMFDFEIAEDVGIANEVIPAINRSRPWRS